jgi:copper(I)-binding protein
MNSRLMALPLLLILGAAPAFAADTTVGPLRISQPWARATPKGASVGGAYMTVTNTGTTPDHLTCATQVAAKCQMHAMEMDKGVMKMRELPDGLEVKPGQTVKLSPEGFHMMLVGLTQPLETGKTIAITLKDPSGGSADVTFAVAGIGAMGPAGAASSGAMPGMQMHEH